MKKSLLALAIVSAAASAADHTNLYGSLAFDVGAVDNNQPGTSATFDANNIKARFGIKGEEDLGNGMAAVFRFELDAEKDGGDKGLNNTRLAYIGLKGDSWGAITLGKQQVLSNLYADKTDIFQSFDLPEGFYPKSLRYTSPEFGGFVFAVDAVIDGSHTVIADGKRKHINYYDVAAHYRNSGFEVGANYWKLSGEGQSSTLGPIGSSVGRNEAMGISAAYGNSQFRVAGDYFHSASIGDTYKLSGEYFLGQHTLRAKAAMVDFDHAKKAYEYHAGYQFNFSPRTAAWVEGQYAEQGNYDEWQVYTGMRHDF
ncbi:MAG: porin [Cardiobacteriaceae bacterium]|nr:porin [Cardiobacteriaceae bacterium]